MNYIDAVILGVIEGITEFLPISSTGHMVIASHWMGISEDQFVKNFEVIIQFGAILSVLVLYWKRFSQSFEFYKKLFVAFLPTAIIGFFLKHQVDIWLESVTLVASTLFIGGIVLIGSDTYFKGQIKSGKTDSELSWKDCVVIGLWQSIAIIPGVSRSAATIIGGLSRGLNRQSATEFSFFLAVPTMAAATTYKLAKSYKTITLDQISTLSIGFIVSFIVSILAIRFFISLVSKSGFKYFGIYRMILGLLIFIVLVIK